MLPGDRLHSVVQPEPTYSSSVVNSCPPVLTAPGMRKGSTGRSRQTVVANPLFSVM